MGDFDIIYYYEEGEKALKNRNYHLAANMFKNCFETYENADLHTFNETIKNYGEGAFDKYNEIVKNFLDDSEFDLIEYGK